MMMYGAPDPLSRAKPLCRQPASDAWRVPRLSGSRRARVPTANWSYCAGACRHHHGPAAFPSPIFATPHPWRGWLKPENRCLVSANSFAEYAPEPNPATGKKDVVWFALNDDRSPFAFGGLWTEFKGDRGTKSKPIPGPHLVYGFLTTAPNVIVEPIHPKAMPLILTTDEERERGCVRLGTRRRPCSGHCRMTLYGSWRVAPIRKTARLA